MLKTSIIQCGFDLFMHLLYSKQYHIVGGRMDRLLECVKECKNNWRMPQSRYESWAYCVIDSIKLSH